MYRFSQSLEKIKRFLTLPAARITMKKREPFIVDEMKNESLAFHAKNRVVIITESIRTALATEIDHELITNHLGAL